MDDIDTILSPILDRLEAACQTIGKQGRQLEELRAALELEKIAHKETQRLREEQWDIGKAENTQLNDRIETLLNAGPQDRG